MRGRGGGASPVIMEKCNKQIDRIVTLIKWSHYLISLSHHFSLNFNKLGFFLDFAWSKKKFQIQIKKPNQKLLLFRITRKRPVRPDKPPPPLCGVTTANLILAESAPPQPWTSPPHAADGHLVLVYWLIFNAKQRVDILKRALLDLSTLHEYIRQNRSMRLLERSYYWYYNQEHHCSCKLLNFAEELTLCVVCS